MFFTSKWLSIAALIFLTIIPLTNAFATDSQKIHKKVTHKVSTHKKSSYKHRTISRKTTHRTSEHKLAHKKSSHKISAHHKVPTHRIRNHKVSTHKKESHRISHSKITHEKTTYTNNGFQDDELISSYFYPHAVQRLISDAIHLSEQHLSYIYGSDTPKSGGMDCSGTIHYLLTTEGFQNIPREADQLYRWVWQRGKFYAVNGINLDSFEFADLKPGDLLFWSNTYPTNRSVPVTHVMLYVGKNKYGQPLMFGASDAHRYHSGVNVYEFTMHRTKGHFLGYGCIPDVSCGLTTRITYAIRQTISDSDSKKTFM